MAFTLVFNWDSSRECNGQASKKGSSLSMVQDSLLKLCDSSIVVPQECLVQLQNIIERTRYNVR